MKRWICRGLSLALVIPVLLLSGCLFNVFQTAQMVSSGDVSFLLGTGVMDIGINDTSNWILTPQARVSFGLSDSANLGLQTGATLPLSGGDLGWLGFRGDVKFSIVDDPMTVSLAVGGGYGLHFIGWGICGGVFVDLNAIPLFIGYHPTIALGEGGWGLWHDIAVGVAVSLSPRVRLLAEIDTRNFWLLSYGLGFDVEL